MSLNSHKQIRYLHSKNILKPENMWLLHPNMSLNSHKQIRYLHSKKHPETINMRLLHSKMSLKPWLVTSPVAVGQCVGLYISNCAFWNQQNNIKLASFSLKHNRKGHSPGQPFGHPTGAESRREKENMEHIFPCGFSSGSISL